jgi:hypothetical protein
MVEPDSKIDDNGKYQWNEEQQAQNATVSVTEATPLLPKAAAANLTRLPDYSAFFKVIEEKMIVLASFFKVIFAASFLIWYIWTLISSLLRQGNFCKLIIISS